MNDKYILCFETEGKRWWGRFADHDDKETHRLVIKQQREDRNKEAEAMELSHRQAMLDMQQYQKEQDKRDREEREEETRLRIQEMMNEDL
jgi:hypothetical protein